MKMMGWFLAQGAARALTDETVSEVSLTWNEALSGILGSISLACWIFVFVPQIWENFTSKSASGLSLAFVGVWLVGDLTNFTGAVLADLVPTVIALAVWYIVADLTLLLQAFYYNYINGWQGRDKSSSNGSVTERTGEHHREAIDRSPGDTISDEHAPLLRRTSIDVPGSRRRNSSLRRELRANTVEVGAGSSKSREVIKNTAAVFALFVVGTAAWAVAYATGAWKPTPVRRGGDELVEDNTLAVILGYVSAVCYLGARIPQIVKNFRDQSCEGLSLLFFILSLVGNITFGAQIFFHSLDKRYLLTNLPWLLGSLGTIGEDMTIFVQFSMYKKDKKGGVGRVENGHVGSA